MFGRLVQYAYRVDSGGGGGAGNKRTRDVVGDADEERASKLHRTNRSSTTGTAQDTSPSQCARECGDALNNFAKICSQAGIRM